jgi:hypothetical protein
VDLRLAPHRRLPAEAAQAHRPSGLLDDHLAALDAQRAGRWSWLERVGTGEVRGQGRDHVRERLPGGTVAGAAHGRDDLALAAAHEQIEERDAGGAERAQAEAIGSRDDDRAAQGAHVAAAAVELDGDADPMLGRQRAPGRCLDERDARGGRARRQRPRTAGGHEDDGDGEEGAPPPHGRSRRTR